MVTATRLIDDYDAALFDMDGVVYRGQPAVPGAPEALAKLRESKVKIGFVTNNAARNPQTVVSHLREIGIEAYLEDVVTSAQAVAKMLTRYLGAGASVYVVGTEALADEVRANGFRVIYDIEVEQPDAVIQGYDPEMTQPRLDEGGYAIQRGARWFATNTDMSRPTQRGLSGGAGGQIKAVEVVVGQIPEDIAGKPYPSLLYETVERLSSKRPIFVGDRIDTDIMGAVAVNMDSLFVFTGAHGVQDLLEAGRDGRPTYIGYDLQALVEPARQAKISGKCCRCRGQLAQTVGGVIQAELPDGREEQLDTLWAVLQLAWQDPTRDASIVKRLDKLH